MNDVYEDCEEDNPSGNITKKKMLVTDEEEKAIKKFENKHLKNRVIDE
jgi:hypothetical protein